METYSERIGAGYSTYYGQTEPDWYWTYSPGDSFTVDHGEFRYTFRANALGLRAPDTAWAEGASIRLAVFGDSFTEGVGAAAGESYPAVLEALLREQGVDVTVYNAGSSGSDPFYGYTLLRDKVLPLGPTHVLFALNSTEWGDYIFRGGFERFLPDGTTVSREAPAIEPLYRHSRLARAVFHGLLGYNSLLIRNRDYPEWRAQATDAIAACLDSAYALCLSQGVAFAAFTHPIPAELCPDIARPADIGLLQGAETAYPFLDLSAKLEGELAPVPCGSWSWPVDGHFKPAGYAAVADELAGSLMALDPPWLVHTSGLSE